jgi:hypothetical protein
MRNAVPASGSIGILSFELPSGTYSVFATLSPWPIYTSYYFQTPQFYIMIPFFGRSPTSEGALWSRRGW